MVERNLKSQLLMGYFHSDLSTAGVHRAMSSSRGCHHSVCLRAISGAVRVHRGAHGALPLHRLRLPASLRLRAYRLRALTHRSLLGLLPQSVHPQEIDRPQ